MIDEKNQRDDSEEGGSGSGGQGSGIAFRYHDAAEVAPRDDALPPSQVKHLEIVQIDRHKSVIDSQKRKREERKAIKEGKQIYTNAARHGRGLGGGGGGSSPFKKHPISNTAQFGAGTDNTVNPIPSQNQAETNNEEKQRHENEYVHRLKYMPKPTAPTLKRY